MFECVCCSRPPFPNLKTKNVHSVYSGLIVVYLLFCANWAGLFANTARTSEIFVGYPYIDVFPCRIAVAVVLCMYI